MAARAAAIVMILLLFTAFAAVGAGSPGGQVAQQDGRLEWVFFFADG